MAKQIRSRVIEAVGSPPGPIIKYFLSPEEIAQLPPSKPIPKSAKKPLHISTEKNRKSKAIVSSTKK